jgi:DNA-binding LytR/AlgR family response regulator
MRFIQVTTVGQDKHDIINLDAIESLYVAGGTTIIHMISGTEKIVTETLAQLQAKAAAATSYP